MRWLPAELSFRRIRARTVIARQPPPCVTFFSEDAQVYGAYTRSLAHTNQVLNPVLGSIFFSGQQSAPLAWDAPNRFLTWGWTPNAHMEDSIQLFFRVPHRLSL